MSDLTIWTDGGCRGNPGIGAWAFVLLDGDEIVTQLSGGEKLTTNNRMELLAVISGIEAAKVLNPESISVNTDSQYVKNGITTWIRNWKRNGWRTASKQPVKNRELWMALDELTSSLNVTFSWVKGHAGIKYNEMCDTMVNEEMDRLA